MFYATPSTAISALHEILKWSVNRPEWQRDALRRIVVKSLIDENDLKDFVRLCRAKHKEDTSTESTVRVELLAEMHLPLGPCSEESVTLGSIGNLQHVNRLLSNQVITFGAVPGLTVIYGDNGSGKSGYARVIKKACRARGVSPIIHPNVFATTPTGVASATIVYQVASKDVPVDWVDNTASDSRLASVFVFDSSAAGHYLHEDGPATFTPYGLDVLPRLSKVCDQVRAHIQQDIDAINASISNVTKNWKYVPTTLVGKLLGYLSATTKTADVDNLSSLDIKQKQQLKDLREALKSDPKQKAKETRAAAARLKVFAAKVTTATGNLSDEKINALQKLIDEAKTTADLAKAFTAGQFDSTYLSGCGSDLWRKMWDAAREFSVTSAYKDQLFPVTDSARCVLCQQDLDAKAVERFKAFDVFCKDQSQQLAASSVKRLKDAADNVAKMAALCPELDKVDADLSTMIPEQRTAILDFVKNVDERLPTINDNLTKGMWVNPVAIPPSPVDALSMTHISLEARAKTEESADDPKARKKLEAEYDELNDREWLVGVKADVLEQIERYRHVKNLQECLRDTATAPITAKSTDLTKLIVTESFCQRFKDEATSLGLRTLEVNMEEIKGKKGETKFGLRLDGAVGHKVKEIASEGEQSCIALAAFLAELSQTSHQSSLVFDDPVSSLDHWHREKIAVRLVEESKTRQVIVFTHDAVFLNDLQSSANRENVSSEIFHLEWNSNIPGQCVKGLPWDLKSADDRFDKLEKEQRAILKDWNSIPNNDNVQSIRHAYSWLRATLERIVEKEIFADVIFRFRSYVDIKKLDGATGFTLNECKELQRLVQRCHDVTEAHDAAYARQSAIPEPTDLAKDIADAKQLLVTIRDRRKVVTKPTIPVINQGSTP